jgi:hypothetical protein
MPPSLPAAGGRGSEPPEHIGAQERLTVPAPDTRKEAHRSR